MVEVKILGSNAAFFAYGRHQSSQLIRIGQGDSLIDCGEGTQLRMKQFGVRPGRLKRIFISHLHGDHIFGLPGLLSTLHMGGRSEDMHLFGPKGLSDILTTIFKQSGSILNYKVHFHEMTPGQTGVIYEENEFFVETFPLTHRITCHGFRFQEKEKGRRIVLDKLPQGQMNSAHFEALKAGKDIEIGGQTYDWQEHTRPPLKVKSYSYCSDTAYEPSLVPFIKDSDLLYHESTFLGELADRAKATFHSTSLQAAEIAKQANVGKLLMGHFSSRYKEIEMFETEAKTIFPNSAVAIEGQTYKA